MGFPTSSATFFGGFPRIRTIVFWGLYCGPLILETTIFSHSSRLPPSDPAVTLKHSIQADALVHSSARNGPMSASVHFGWLRDWEILVGLA